MIRRILEAIDERLDYSSGKSPRSRGVWSKQPQTKWSKGIIQQMGHRTNPPERYVGDNPGTPPYVAVILTDDGDVVWTEKGIDDFIKAKMHAENYANDPEYQSMHGGNLSWRVEDAEGDVVEEE